MDALARYLGQAGGRATVETVNYISSLELVRRISPEVASSIVKELEDQRCGYLKLIASENFSSLSVQAAMANLLTDKYAEGFPGHRFYAGCDNVDAIESLAVEKAKELFGAEHAYVQPHSGADANLCAYWAILNTRVQLPSLEEMGVSNVSDMSREDWNRIREKCHNQRLLGLDYYSGGHLTHGYRQNISAQLFDAYSYSVDPQTMLLDYDDIERKVREVRPLILLAGYSAYPRRIDFKRLSEIAHANGAVFMVDMAHFAGLVAPDQVHRYLALADLLWHLSLHEGLPRSVVQALATGIPAVGFRLDGTPEVVIDGETGYCVAPQSVEEVAEATRRLWLDPERARTMGENGRKLVLEKFRWETMVDILEREYRELLDRVSR